MSTNEYSDEYIGAVMSTVMRTMSTSECIDEEQ
jgi:hypothetical protein